MFFFFFKRDIKTRVINRRGSNNSFVIAKLIKGQKSYQVSTKKKNKDDFLLRFITNYVFSCLVNMSDSLFTTYYEL